MLKEIIHIGLTILFPEYCLGCRRWGRIVCDNCLTKISKSDLTDLPDNLHAGCQYNHPLTKQLIGRLKYRGSGPAARRLAPFLLAELDCLPIKPSQKIGLIPVPATWAKDRRRGYNQAEILAQALADAAPTGQITVYTRVVKKIKTTKDQTTTAGRRERLNNLIGVFAITDRFDPRACDHWIIIDDVITTGATMTELEKVLIRAGAKSVWGLAAAH